MPNLSTLPPPVARYLEHVLRDGQPMIRRLRLKQSGQLRTRVESSRWLPFGAEQVIDPVSVGYVWDARVSILPLVHVRVRDSYAAGRASSQVRLLSVIPMASEGGRYELNSGALHRYLAEAAWYPTALLPSSALQWRPVNSSSALATLTDAGASVSLEFRFNEAHEITSVYTSGRWEKVTGGYRQTPWEGRFHSYRERQNMVVPSGGEVGWYHDGTWQKVWTGEIVGSEYEFVQ